MLTEGGTVTAMNAAGYTNTYVLSSDGMGMWTAALPGGDGDGRARNERKTAPR